MQIIQQLFEIIIRKRQPQDIAFSVNAAIMMVALTVALGTLAYSQVPQFSMPLAYSLTLSVVQALAIYGLLALFKKTNRFVQTITALYGVSVILQILTILVSLVGPLASLGLLFTVWNIVLIISILRASLDCSTLQAIAQTIGYHMLMIFVIVLIFPKFPQEIQTFLEQTQAQANGQ